jgi:glutamine cyclotransferase
MSRRTNLLIIGLAILILVVAVAVVLPQWRSATPSTAPVNGYPAPMAAGESTATATPPAPTSTVAPTPAAAADQANPLPAPPTPATLRRYTYRVVNVLPHDPNAFTQGLVYADGIFYEGTGRNGQSWLRKVEPATGAVLQQHDLEEQYFGEGIALFGDKIYQLTWQSNTGFVYDKESFAELSRFAYPTEGWGLTDNGSELIMSDGTATLYFWEPETLQETRRLDVTYQGEPLVRLNELEYFDDAIWANVWQSDAIVRIDPATGVVDGLVDLRGLLNYGPALTAPVDVLNGIAYDEATGRLFVTGKLWPAVFEIEVIEVTQ